MSIVTLAAAKAQLNIASSDTSQDIELQTYLDAATLATERARGEVIEQRAVVDEMTFTTPTTSFLLQSAPVVSLTSIARVDGSATWSTDATVTHVEPRSGRVTLLSGPSVLGLITVTYTAGYAAVPVDFQLAALVILQHLWETQRGALGGGVQLGGDTDTYVPGRGFAIPRRALELLGLSLPGIA